MTFILSPEIIDDILFAMENQTELFSFDAREGMCVGRCEIDDEFAADGSERYYGIPHWTSADGFRLMELFTARVHNPALRAALQDALRQRKGVFRRYKAVLATAPTIEQEWYRFKDARMKEAVYEWYNKLRMIWGLEKISFEEETENQLLLEDFVFQIKKRDELDAELLRDFIRKTDWPADDDDNEMLSFDETAAIAAGRLLGQAAFFDADVCAATEREYGITQGTAAYITAYNETGLCGLCAIVPFPIPGSFCIPFLRVLPEYRGLGLGKELLQRTCSYSEPIAATLIFADFCTPSHGIALLEREGFERMGLLYVKDMDASDEEPSGKMPTRKTF